MTDLKLFFPVEDDQPCQAEELAELHAEPCDNIADYYGEDRETGEITNLCAAHKDEAKILGIAS